MSHADDLVDTCVSAAVEVNTFGISVEVDKKRGGYERASTSA